MIPYFIESARWHRIAVFFFRSQASEICYLSIPVIALGLLAMVRAGWLGFLLGVGAILTALGAITPFHSVSLSILKAIPGFTMFRFPLRLTILTSFFAAGAAALGLDRLGALGSVVRGRRRLVVELVAIATVVVLLVLPHRNSLAVPWASPNLVGRDPGFFPGVTRPSSDYRGWVPGGQLDLQTGRFTRRQAMREHVRVLQDYEPLSSRRLGTFLAAVTGTPPPKPDDFIPFTGSVPREPVMTRPDLLDLVAISKIMTSHESVPPGIPPPGWTEIRREGDLVWYDNARALPRAYVVDRAHVVANEDAALAELVSRGVDVHREAVLVGAATPAAAALSGVAESVATPGRIVTDEPERVVVEVERAQPGVLVLADSFAPGWTATVDGAPRTLWQTNYLVRGVLVGPGERRVEFRYRAPGFVSGVTLCMAAWGSVLGATLLGRRRAR
jgi:hypothetical protein